MRAPSLKESSHSSHAMFSTQLDPPFTAPTQSTSTSSSLLFPSNGTPTAAPLFGRFAEQSPLTGYEPTAPCEVSSEATPVMLPSRRCSLESTCNDLATTIDVSEAGERSDLGRLASPLWEFSTQVERILLHPPLIREQALRNRWPEVRTKEIPVETQVLRTILS